MAVIYIACGNAQSVKDSEGPRDQGILPGIFQTHDYRPLLTGKRIGVVCNAASVAGKVHLVDTLLMMDADLRYIFVPEHGFRATADRGATIEDETDPVSGLPVISLYTGKEEFPARYLDSIDVLVFDLQDVGVRFFTYINALLVSMEVCAAKNVPLVVLDRPNPNGFYVDGPMLEEEFYSGIGMLPLPVVYGLTIGELATMINGEGWLRNTGDACRLHVIKCINYDHTMTYEPPVRPSPNLPNLRSLLLYPSLCFFEGTTVSVGRGTNSQFQVIGHPGLITGSYSFTPQPMAGASKPLHNGTPCYGQSFESMSPESIMQWRRINLSWLINYYTQLAQLGETYFLKNNYIDKLAGTDQLRLDIIAGKTEEEIRQSWQPGLAKFKQLRKQYVLYPDFH